MCGIAGILSFDLSRLRAERTQLETMRDTMVHRGPDGAGVWADDAGRIGLAHRRLSIVDLSSAASQPMATRDGRYHIVFNGEIYNHRELRTELVSRGHSNWTTDHSDTEVILHSFREWGIDCLARFRGMFAFALWDSTDRVLWLVRDRMGVKPLYFARDARGVVFASEIKAILAGPARERAVDETALFHYLSFMTTPAPMTLFKGIFKLPSTTWMRISVDGTTQERRWWDPLDGLNPATGQSEGAIASGVLDELRTAVSYRKVSDVPVGVFLSGGIDSSANLALFSEGETTPVKTFSIGYAGTQNSVADELPYARMIAEQTGAVGHERLLTQDDLLDFLPRMIELQDEPIGDPVCVPVYYVSKLARDNGVIVCQVGEGADELFCGYPGWKTFLDLERWNAWPVPRAAKRVGVAALRAAGLGNRRATEFLRRAGEGLPVFWGGAEAFPEGHKRAILSPRLREIFRDRSSWEALAPIRQRFEDKAWDRSPLNWMTYLDLNLRLPELLLMRVDKMSMGASVEARVPFLDHNFIKRAMEIPAEMKIRGGELKHVLKTAVRGLLPDAIIDRRKQGFAVPVQDWIMDRLGREADSILADFCAQTDFLDPTAVQMLRRRGSAEQIWYLLNLALWWRHYIRA